MSEHSGSKLKFYSLGIVVFDKEEGSDYIKVLPIEELNLENGEIGKIKKKYEVNTPDAKGVKRTNQIEGDAVVIAKWKPLSESNRITAPDVYKNETVLLLSYADTNEFFWVDLGREPGLRRLETVCYALSNLPGGTEAFDKSTSYWIEYSTKEKHIKLHTSKNDGEPFAYDITINAKQGNITITDNAGITVELNSQTQQITATVPKFVINGDLEVNGSISSSSGMSSSSGLSVQGPITATEAISTPNEVHGSNIP